MRRLLLVGAAALALLSARPAGAQTSIPALVFVAVDAVQVELYRLTVTGVLEGEGEPRTVSFTLSSSTPEYAAQQVASCERLAVLAMTRPGQFRFEARGSPYVLCKLARVTP